MRGEVGADQDRLVDRVRTHANGVSARELIGEFVTVNGLSRRDAERAVQRMLDRGDVRIGSGLRLFAHEASVAA